MDSPSTPEFSQTPDEEDSAGTQPASEVLAKNLSNLTLSPGSKLPSLPPKRSPQQQDREKDFKGPGLGLNPRVLHTRRRGVRTVASVRKERLQQLRERMRMLAIGLRCREKLMAQEGAGFLCGCTYCLTNVYPYKDINENCDME